MSTSTSPDEQATVPTQGRPGTEFRPIAPLFPAAAEDLSTSVWWLGEASRDNDLHVGFLGQFTLVVPALLTIKIAAPATLRLWVDGQLRLHGVNRFAPGLVEYEHLELHLAAGEHHLAAEVHHEGVMTRMTAPLPGFLLCRVEADGAQVDVRWSARELIEYRSGNLRVSPLAGWLERRRSAPRPWSEEDPDHQPWGLAVQVGDHLEGLDFTHCMASILPSPLPRSAPVHPMGSGRFRDGYASYELEDPVVSYLAADLDPVADVDGQWARFDLGRVRIGSADLDLRCAEPTTVTIAYASRRAASGQLVPGLPLSDGPSCALQQYDLAPGDHQVRPLQAIGARYLEVRLRSAGAVTLDRVDFRERDVLGPPRGSLDLGDPELHRIWRVGLETATACVEDVLVDSVRERGQWLGDVLVATELLAVGWGDLRPIRRALVHFAACASADGLVAGCAPGEIFHLGTYACLWVSAVVRYVELTSDLSLLTDLRDAGRGNLAALVNGYEKGLPGGWPWPFIDWGEAPDNPGSEAILLGYLQLAVRSWRRWLLLLGRTDEAASWEDLQQRLGVRAAAGRAGNRRRYHLNSMLAYSGQVRPSDVAAEILTELRRGFPFDPGARRLRRPGQVVDHVTTPFFTHFSVDTLLRAGLVEEATEIWRTGWGWMIDQGATTWWEVFDDGWSTCHVWSGAPTWQMTRHLLGVDERLDVDGRRLRIAVRPGRLTEANGTVPIVGVGDVQVAWVRSGSLLDLSIETPAPVEIEVGARRETLPVGPSTLCLRLGTAGCYDVVSSHKPGSNRQEATR